MDQMVYMKPITHEFLIQSQEHNQVFVYGFNGKSLEAHNSYTLREQRAKSLWLWNWREFSGIYIYK